MFFNIQPKLLRTRLTNQPLSQLSARITRMFITANTQTRKRKRSLATSV